MVDLFGRTIDYLRVSVTDRCNLRCIYCIPEDGVAPLTHQEILTYEELERICACAGKLGIQKIKLTGGEPLVRRDVADLVRQLKRTKGIQQVTMTTNGVYLNELANALAQAGLDGLNVSLDTLDRNEYAGMTRRDELPRVLAGIDNALKAGLRVKINCVPTVQSNFDGLCRIAEIAREQAVQVRFIEMMPVGLGSGFTGVSNETLKACMEERFGKFIPCSHRFGNGPAVYYTLDGFLGHIGFISALSDKFCAGCNRIRLTPSGFLKLCLCYDQGIDLKTPLREGITDEMLLHLLEQAIRNKPASHRFEQRSIPHRERLGMSQIGG